jgi:hypothetical protein
VVTMPSRKAMSQFGPRQTMQQSYSNTVSNAAPAFQQMRGMEQQNPLIGRQVALRGLINRPVKGGQQYAQLQQQAKPITEFAGYVSRQGGGDARNIVSDIGQNGLANYGRQLGNFGDWKNAETKRANASGMLSSGFGAMIPGLAMAAFPGAGLAKIAQGAAMGGMGGGVRGALLGGAASAVAPAINVPGGIGGAIKAPVQAAANVARQFGNPVTAGRQALAFALGNYRKR